MTRIVSITWNAVSRDSRTFKIAASMRRFGYESIVVESQPSDASAERFPFQVVTLPSGLTESSPMNGDQLDEAGTDGIPREPEMGIAARVASLVPERAKPRLRPLAEACFRLIDPVLVLGGLLASNLRAVRRLPAADLYYLHSWWYFPAVYVKARRAGARIVYDAHDANWEPDPGLDESFGSPATIRMLERLERLCARTAMRFITVGNGVAGLLETRFKRRPTVVRNFHDLRLDEETPRDIRDVTGVPGDAYLLVQTGAAKPGDCFEEALTALERLPDRVHLALVGRDHEPRQALVDERGLSERVHLLAPVPPTEVASFIRTADASPILYQSFSDQYLYALPNRFFHGIAAGLPILYPPLPEIKAICEEHDLGIEIDPTHAGSIVAATSTLIENPELADRYGENVRQARELLSWEHEEAILSGLLAETLAGKRGG